MFVLKPGPKNKSIYLLIVVLIAIPTAAWHSCVLADDKILFFDTFESSPIGKKPIRTGDAPWMNKCSGNCPVVSKEEALYGDRSMKTYLHRDKSKRSYRTEMVLAGGVINKGVRQGEDWWYAFSIFIPGNHIADSVTHDVVAQWHANKDKGEGNLGGPPVGLRINNTNWELDVNWTSKPITTKKNIIGQRYKLGPIEPGVWTNWVFHFKWSYNNDGVLEVWKNGSKVVNRNGPNNYNDKTGPFLKVGLYKTAWRSDAKGDINIKSRTFYHDGFVVARGEGIKISDITSRLKGGKGISQDQSLSPPKNLKISK